MAVSFAIALALLQATASITPAQAGATNTSPPPSAPTAAQPTADAAADTSPPDPIVCRRTPDPGSPMFSTKECHRVSMWNRMARQ